MSLRFIPNLLTILRFLLIGPIIYLLVEHRFTPALVLTAAAVFSDGLDGFLARQFDWRTRLGSILDPLADKLLSGSVFVTLALLGIVPVWLVALVLGRDLLIVIGGLSYHFLVGPFEMEPSIISKLNTLVQLLFILTVLANSATQIPYVTVQVTGAALVFTTIASGIDYVIRWSRRALSAGRAAS